RRPFSTLDRYLLVHVAGTLASVFSIVISLMMFEHLPRLFDVVRLSGRKTYVVVQSMVSLLPEYASIGLLFGLYLATALTVRRLSLRGELDVLEATGVPPWRWMRFPALLAVAVAALLLLNQGWLMPAGERRLIAIGQEMVDGSFGYDLENRQFTDLGNGVMVRFDGVERTDGALRGVFLHTDKATFSASRGRLGFDFGGDVLLDLQDGRMVGGSTGQALSFSQFHLDSGGRRNGGATTAEKDRRKSMTLAALLGSDKPVDRAAAWSRLLWPGFALTVPLLAVVLGKPTRRTSSSLGLMAGLLLLVLFIRTAGIVATTPMDRPGLLAAIFALAWAAAAGLLVHGERVWGAGYVDASLRWLAGRLGKLRRRSGGDHPRSLANQDLSRRQAEAAASIDGTLAFRAPELVSA
ncbi:MAG: LptF/LptG family permease, partial [Porphyrobacter sp.]|nr:LptF/LptG family permease [Porphyrobacter sp.]